MSDELERLRHQLERATAPECPADGSLDAETASLREGWLALGHVLKAVEPSLGEPVKLREPAKDRPGNNFPISEGDSPIFAARKSGQSPSCFSAAPKPGRRTGGKAAGIVALAASLLVGVTLAGKWIGAGRPGDPASVSEYAVSAMIKADGERVGPGAKELEAASLADRLVWDDPLDEQIASVAQQVVHIQQDWYQVDGDFGPLFFGLEEIAEDLDQSPL